MFCKNCGKELSDGSKYCFKCGMVFNEENGTNIQNNEAVNRDDVNPFRIYNANDSLQQVAAKPKNSGKGIKIAIIAIGVFLILSIILFVIITLSSQEQSNQAKEENIVITTSEAEVIDEPSVETYIDQAIVGKWEHIGQNENMAFEFFADGTFHYMFQDLNCEIRKVSGNFSMTENMLILENSPQKNHKYIIEDDWLYIWLEGIKFDLWKRDYFGFNPIIDENDNCIDPDYTFDESVASNGEVVGTNFNQGGIMDIMIYEGKVEDIASFVDETYWTQTGTEYKPEGGYIQGFDNNFPYIDDFNENEFQISFLDGERFEECRQEPAGISGEWYTEEYKYIMDPVGYYIFTNPREVEIDGESVVLVEMFFAKQDKLYGLTLANDIPCSNIVEYKKITDSTPDNDIGIANTDIKDFIGVYNGSYENNSGPMKLAIKIYEYEKADDGDYYKVRAEFHFKPNDSSSSGKAGSYDMKGIIEITEENFGYIILDGEKWISEKPSDSYNMLGLEGWIDINKGTFYGLLDRENNPEFHLVKE